MGSEIIIAPAAFLALVTIIKTLSNNRLKRQIVERGQLENLDGLKVLNADAQDPMVTVKWGLASIGVGLALLLSNLGPFHINEETTVGLMFFFAGSAFLIYYRLSSTKADKDASTN